MMELKLRKAYIEYCYADTIRATWPDYYDQYIVDWGNYREMVSHEELLDRGYRYKGRIVIDSVLNVEHLFIGKPTFEGYTIWLNNLMNEK